MGYVQEKPFIAILLLNREYEATLLLFHSKIIQKGEEPKYTQFGLKKKGLNAEQITRNEHISVSVMNITTVQKVSKNLCLNNIICWRRNIRVAWKYGNYLLFPEAIREQISGINQRVQTVTWNFKCVINGGLCCNMQCTHKYLV